MGLEMKLGKVGLVGRFKPLHLGGAALLDSICERSDHVIIAIGSANKYNYRNPFTPDETKEMIDSYLKQNFDNYELRTIDDTGKVPGVDEGSVWTNNVQKLFGELDYFLTGNDYVEHLLKDVYEVIHPSQIVPQKLQLGLNATTVRVAMANESGWETLVPDCVAEYITENKLDKRFKEEFGNKTITELTVDPDYLKPKDLEYEKNQTLLE